MLLSRPAARSVVRYFNGPILTTLQTVQTHHLDKCIDESQSQMFNEILTCLKILSTRVCMGGKQRQYCSSHQAKQPLAATNAPAASPCLCCHVSPLGLHNRREQLPVRSYMYAYSRRILWCGHFMAAIVNSEKREEMHNILVKLKKLQNGAKSVVRPNYSSPAHAITSVV